MPWIKRGDGCTGIPLKMQWAWALHKVGVRGMLRGKRNCLSCGLPIAVDGRGGHFSRTILREGWHLPRPPGPGDTEGMERCAYSPVHVPEPAQTQPRGSREPGPRARAESHGTEPGLCPQDGAGATGAAGDRQSTVQAAAPARAAARPGPAGTARPRWHGRAQSTVCPSTQITCRLMSPRRSLCSPGVSWVRSDRSAGRTVTDAGHCCRAGETEPQPCCCSQRRQQA